MTDINTQFRNVLIGATPVTSLVPASRIFVQWPTSFQTLPVISYRITNNFLAENDIMDDAQFSEHAEVTVDVFCPPGSSPTSIVRAVDSALFSDNWMRGYCEYLTEPETGIIHTVMRFEKVVLAN